MDFCKTENELLINSDAEEVKLEINQYKIGQSFEDTKNNLFLIDQRENMILYENSLSTNLTEITSSSTLNPNDNMKNSKGSQKKDEEIKYSKCEFEKNLNENVGVITDEKRITFSKDDKLTNMLFFNFNSKALRNKLNIKTEEIVNNSNNLTQNIKTKNENEETSNLKPNNKKNSCNVYDVFLSDAEFAVNTIPLKTEISSEKPKNTENNIKTEENVSTNAKLYGKKTSLSVNKVVKKISNEKRKSSLRTSSMEIMNKENNCNFITTDFSARRSVGSIAEIKEKESEMLLIEKRNSIQKSHTPYLAFKEAYEKNCAELKGFENQKNLKILMKEKLRLDINTNFSMNSSNLGSVSPNYTKKTPKQEHEFIHKKDELPSSITFNKISPEKMYNKNENENENLKINGQKNLDLSFKSQVSSKSKNSYSKNYQKRSLSPNFLNSSMVYNKNILNKKNNFIDDNQITLGKLPNNKETYKLKENITKFKDKMEYNINFNKISFNEFKFDVSSNEQSNIRNSTPVKENFENYNKLTYLDDINIREAQNINGICLTYGNSYSSSGCSNSVPKNIKMDNIFDGNKNQNLPSDSNGLYMNDKKIKVLKKNNINFVDDIYYRENKRQEKLNKMRIEREFEIKEEEQKYSFKPNINKKFNGNNIKKNDNENFQKEDKKVLKSNFIDRINYFNKLKEEKLINKQKLAEKEEFSNCTFTPKTNNNQNKIQKLEKNNQKIIKNVNILPTSSKSQNKTPKNPINYSNYNNANYYEKYSKYSNLKNIDENNKNNINSVISKKNNLNNQDKTIECQNVNVVITKKIPFDKQDFSNKGNKNMIVQKKNIDFNIRKDINIITANEKVLFDLKLLSNQKEDKMCNVEIDNYKDILRNKLHDLDLDN